MKINTDFIEKDYSLNLKAVSSSKVINAVYAEQDFPSINETNSFPYTILINNKSKTFIRNTNFNYNNNSNENTIDILNINFGKINGYDINISNLNNTFIANINNSQSTIKCDKLSTVSLFNARNEDQSFFNFPVPTDTKNFIVQPMMISNGQRTIWSEGKYGWINADRILSFTDFQKYVPHDLNGQNFVIKSKSNQILAKLNNYHNGSLTIIGDKADDNETNIEDCSIKLVLSGFNFKHLNIKNCTNVYLQDCSFNKSNRIYGMREIEGSDTNPWNFKRSDFSHVINYCLKSSNSKIFIKNATKNLIFSNFYLGIHADNNSQIYMIPEKDNIGILLQEDLSNYNEQTSNRPIFMLATNGSVINCNYYNIKDNKYINTFSASIVYPETMNLGYKGNNVPFEITNNEYFSKNDNDNYKRVKSLLISLWSQINNGKVNFNLNRYKNIEQPSEISVPPFGLYQVAKPKLNIKNSKWQLANNYYHILSGTQDNHISGVGNNEWYLNVYNNGAIQRNASYFYNYNCPKFTIDQSFINTFPYDGSQPHLAHYFNTSPDFNYNLTVSQRIFKPEIIAKTLLRQNTSNITNMKNKSTSFEAYINGKKLNVFFNPLKNNFYYYNINKEVIDITEQITKFITYRTNTGTDITENVNSYFNTSIASKNDDIIHNIYYDGESNTYYYLENGNIITDIDSQIKSSLTSVNGKTSFIGTASNVTSGTTDLYLANQLSFNEKPTTVSSLNPIIIDNQEWLKLTTLNNEDIYIPKDYFNYSKSTLTNVLDVDTIAKNLLYFNKSISEKKNKKKVISNFDMFYNPKNGKFYYQNNKDYIYDYDASVKNELRYIFTQTIDITEAVTKGATIKVLNNGLENNIRFNSSSHIFQLLDSTGIINLPNDRIKIIFDARNPNNSHYYFIVQKIDITNQVKNSKSHITTYEMTLGKNVDVYYNDVNGFFYWENDKTQKNIVIDTFECILDNNKNEYFTNGLLDISDVLNGTNNSFTTYIDGQNRLVFYNFQQKIFYYWDDEDKDKKVDISNRIIIDEQYIYNDTEQIDIQNVLQNNQTKFYSKVIEGGTWIRYDANTDSFITDANNNVTDLITGFIVSSYNKETEALTGIHYYETTQKDITHIVTNSFIAKIDNVEQVVYYNNSDNTFFIKDQLDNIKNVTDVIKSKIRLTYNGDPTNISGVYLQPNYLSTLIDGVGIYYDDSNNIFYTPSTIPITIQTKTGDDGEILYTTGQQQGEEIDITYALNNYFTAWDYSGTENISYDVYYDINVNKFYAKGSNKDVTNEVNSRLTWYFNGDNINDLLTGTGVIISNIQYNDLTGSVSYNKTTKQYILTSDLNSSVTADITYYVNNNTECYYKNEDITDIVRGKIFFTAEIDGKNRDVYYNQANSSFYLNKLDKTSLILPKIQCYYIITEGLIFDSSDKKRITDIVFNSIDHFDGHFMLDDGSCISSTIYYDANDEWYYFNEENQQIYITNAIKSNIGINYKYTNRININNVVNNGQYFDAFISTAIDGTTSGLITDQVYWDKSIGSAYYLKDNYKLCDAALTNNINYYYKNEIINDIIRHPNNNDYFIPVGTVNVYYDNITNNFYYKETVNSETISTNITNVILENFKVQISNITIPIDLTSVRWDREGINNTVKVNNMDVYYDTATKKFYYKTSNTMGLQCDTDFISHIIYSYNSLNINNVITGDSSQFFIATIGGIDRQVKYIKNSDKFYYESQETIIENGNEITTTETVYCFEDIKHNLTCKYINQNSNTNITNIFINQNDFINIKDETSTQKIYYKNTGTGYNYYYQDNKQYLNNDNVNIYYTNENWFYQYELELSEILNGNTFKTQVIRDTYYYDPSKQFVFNSDSGQKIDITQQLTPYTYNKYYHKVGKEYIDITDVIYNGKSFVTKYAGADRVIYFDLINCNNMSPKTMDFASSFYYMDNFEEKRISTSVSSYIIMSSFYYGNLFDISEKLIRQNVQIFIMDAGKGVQTVYYDLYGGKTKNQGVYYSYKTNGDMIGRTADVSGFVSKQYFYNNKNISDVVNGAHMYHSYKGKDYKVYYDKLTGYFYYLYGDIQKTINGVINDKVSGKVLAYKYSGKVDLTTMKAKKATAFYTYIDDSNKPVVASFSIKNNVVTVTANKADVTNMVKSRLKYDGTRQRYYLSDIDLKHIVFNGQGWFWTPIDGISRRVYFQKWNKTLGKYRYYYTPNNSTTGDKIDVTKKITSRLTYYYNGKNIDRVVKGSYIETSFETSIANATPQKVYYDRKTKVYYYYKKQYLTPEYVKDNIYVDITPVFKYPTKWCFLATVEGNVKQIYYDKKKFYYYLNGKTKVMIDRNQIENSTNYYNKNGDGKEYYHDINISNYLIEDGCLLVMVNGKITEVYYDSQLNQYYYEKDKVNVTELIQAYVKTKYYWDGQVITDVIYPTIGTMQNPRPFLDYTKTFKWNWYGGNKNDGKYYYRDIQYNPDAGFFVKNPDWGLTHAYVFDPEAKTNQNSRIVHDQIAPHLNYFYYDPDCDVETNIDYIITNPEEYYTIKIDGVNRNVYYKKSTNVYTYKRVNPALGNPNYDAHKIHEDIFYYLDENGNQQDVTTEVLNNLVIKFYAKEMTRAIEDGTNYTLLVVDGIKRYVYYNPINKSWYYYKDNKFNRVNISNTMAKNLLYEDDQPKYYCYSTNIDKVMGDLADKYRFLATTQEDVYYDFGTKDFYYFSDPQQTRREIITKQITPNLQTQYWLINGEVPILMTDIIKGITTEFNATINGQLTTVRYDYVNDKYTYTVIQDEVFTANNFLNNTHNYVEMVVSNINNNKKLTDVLNITNSKLYQDIYKF